MEGDREDEAHMFRVEHTGGMSIGSPIIKMVNNIG